MFVCFLWQPLTCCSEVLNSAHWLGTSWPAWTWRPIRNRDLLKERSPRGLKRPNLSVASWSWKFILFSPTIFISQKTSLWGRPFLPNNQSVLFFAYPDPQGSKLISRIRIRITVTTRIRIRPLVSTENCHIMLKKVIIIGSWRLDFCFKFLKCSFKFF